MYYGQTSWKAKHVGYLVIPLFGMFGMSLKLEENILKLNVTIMKCYDTHYVEDVIFLYLQHFISPDLHYYPDSKHELVRVAIRAVRARREKIKDASNWRVKWFIKVQLKVIKFVIISFKKSSKTIILR